MTQMSRRRRVQATWLLLVLFASVSLGVCTTALSAVGGKLPCCPDVPNEQASFTTCCTTGQQSATSELPAGVEAPLPPVSEMVFATPPSGSPDGESRPYLSFDIPYRSVDPQALLSTFLI